MLPITHTTTQAHEWADASQYIIHIGRFTASICLSQMSPVSLLWQRLTLALGRLSRNRNISLSELEMAILNNEQVHEWKKRILCCCGICSLSSLKDKYDNDNGHLVECWKNCINVYIACLRIYPSSLKAFRQCSASQIQNRDDTSNMQQ